MMLDGADGIGKPLLLLAPKKTSAVVMTRMMMVIIALPIVPGVFPSSEKPLREGGG